MRKIFISFRTDKGFRPRKKLNLTFFLLFTKTNKTLSLHLCFYSLISVTVSVQKNAKNSTDQPFLFYIIKSGALSQRHDICLKDFPGQNFFLELLSRLEALAFSIMKTKKLAIDDPFYRTIK